MLFIHPIYTLTAKSLQSCPTLWDPIDGSPPVSPIPGILQARTLEWVASSFFSAWKWKVKVKSLSRVQFFRDPMDCSLPGSSVHGIFQARVLEWGAIAFSTYIYYFAPIPHSQSIPPSPPAPLQGNHTSVLYVCGSVFVSCMCMLSHFHHVRLFATLWTIACQASLSMGFSRQECRSGEPFPSLWDLCNPGIEPASLVSPALQRYSLSTELTWELPSVSQTSSFVSYLGLHL